MSTCTSGSKSAPVLSLAACKYNYQVLTKNGLASNHSETLFMVQIVLPNYHPFVITLIGVYAFIIFNFIRLTRTKVIFKNLIQNDQFEQVFYKISWVFFLFSNDKRKDYKTCNDLHQDQRLFVKYEFILC